MVNDPRNEHNNPEIKCTECEGTGYENFICNHCGYNMANDFNPDPDSIDSYGPDDACPSCRRNDALTPCDACKGEGKRPMTEDELETFKNNQRYSNHEKL